MKRIFILIFVIIIILSLYKYAKIRYLYLEYRSKTGEKSEIIEVTKIEIYGLCLEGYNYEGSGCEKEPPKTVITDKGKIKILMDYLKNIPLKYVKEGDDFNGKSDCSIFFYSNGTMLGWVKINGNSFIYNSIDVTTYRPKDEKRNIILDIKKLEL